MNTSWIDTPERKAARRSARETILIPFITFIVIGAVLGLIGLATAPKSQAATLSSAPSYTAYEEAYVLKSEWNRSWKIASYDDRTRICIGWRNGYRSQLLDMAVKGLVPKGYRASVVRSVVTKALNASCATF
jgi:hypothetical protein